MTLHGTVACAVAIAIASASVAAAQERMPPLPPDRWTAEQQKAVDAFKAARGAEAPVSGPFAVMLRSPEVMERARAMGDYLRFRSALPPQLSEFVILMTAREWTQGYEWSVHYPVAVKAGVSREVAAALAEGRRPETMSGEQAVLFDFCSELLRNKSVSDRTYARALNAFGEKGVIDTLGIVGYYTFLAMMLNVARTPAAAGAAPPLLPLVR